MRPADVALARRAVACPRWRWMPGMLVVAARPGAQSYGAMYVRVGELYDGGDALSEPDDGGGPRWLPDLSDPATLGCLLALVRGAWGCPILHTAAATPTRAAPDGHWNVWMLTFERDIAVVSYCRAVARGASEAEALVVALEGAP